MPAEKLVNAPKVARLETRTTPDLRRPQVVNVRVATFQNGEITSEASYPLSNLADRVTWTYLYQSGRLEKLTGSMGAGKDAPVVTERVFRYDTAGRLAQEVVRSALAGGLEPASETTCTYSPDGRQVTETTRTLAGTPFSPGLLTQYTLDGHGRLVTVSLKDDLSGTMAETNRFQYVHQPSGGYARTDTETNPYSGEVTPRGTFTFDRAGRLVQVNLPTVAGQGSQVKTYVYRFDRVGNWVERVETVLKSQPDGKTLKSSGEVVRCTITYLK